MTDEQLLQIAADHVGKRDEADFSELDLITTERSELIAFGRAVEAELKKANTQTPDDIPPGPLSEAELREQWNAQADEFNQWDSLDSYEQLAWAQVQAIAAHEAARIGLHCYLLDDGPCPSPCVFDDPAEQISNCTHAQGLQRDGKPKTSCPYYRTATAETAPVLHPEEVETRFRAWIQQEHGLIPSQTATTYAAAFALHMLRGEVK